MRSIQIFFLAASHQPQWERIGLGLRQQEGMLKYISNHIPYITPRCKYILKGHMLFVGVEDSARMMEIPEYSNFTTGKEPVDNRR